MTNIFDINVYLWNDVCRYHVYTTDKLILNLPRVMVGNYELRVVCNAGYDLGEECYDLDRLKTADLVGRADHRAMFTHTSQIAVTQHSTSFDIEVTRIFARVYLHVTVADGVPLTLKAVTLHNVPTSGYLFPQPGSVDHPAAEYCRGTSSLHIPQAAKTTQDVVYICENIKPDVPGISSQRERTLDNAPEGATYAYITATNSSGAAFNYVIFPGQNDTDNFSVRRNTSTVFQISIEGTSELDYRVSQVQVAATRHTDKYIDLQKYPTQEYAPVLGQYRFSSASAYDPLPRNCYATFTWRNGSDFPVACSTDNGRTRQPYTPGTELLLTAAGDYSVIFYGAWEKGDIPALGSNFSVVELRYGPGRTLLKSYAQERCIGYSIAFTHVGIPDDLVDWNLTELDTNDGIDRTSTGSTSRPPKFFVYTSTAMSFVEILYDESYPIQGLYANGVRLDIPEDGASMETDYLTPDIPVSTFLPATAMPRSGLPAGDAVDRPSKRKPEITPGDCHAAPPDFLPVMLLIVHRSGNPKSLPATAMPRPRTSCRVML